MCILVYKKSQVRAALKDIECYKVINRFCPDNSNLMLYLTPYVNNYIANNKTLKDGFVFNAIGRARRLVAFDFDYTSKRTRDAYNGGFIHTYKLPKNAAQLSFTHSEVWKCIIPRGTKFIAGTDMFGTKCFASKKIIFKERIV